jgi:uncharacterized protein (DUF302 family)
MSEKDDSGIVAIEGSHSVDRTVLKLQELLTAKGIRLFAVIDHSGEADKAGLQMPNTKLLIFGSPRAGTPIMIASPAAAIDLPLKILVAEDAGGRTRISWNSPGYLQSRHGFPQELAGVLTVVESLANSAAE